MRCDGWRGVVRVVALLSRLQRILCGLALTLIVLAISITAVPADPGKVRMSADERAHRLVAAMSLDEKIALLHTRFGVPLDGHPKPVGSLDSAGFDEGLARLGIPPLQETDAGLGVANPTNAPFNATAMPCSLALAAAFDPGLARDAGTTIGSEARAMGFSVMLAGGANLIREPRGGRNFEYVSEDPLLTGEIAGAEIAGIQSQRIVSTIKHFALNSQENGRIILDARLSETALRESDLLAFEIALERGAPGAVMSSYNRVNGTYTSENAHLLTDILKEDWGFPGWVMADWGGTHSTQAAALAGLDQESGQDNDPIVYFGAPLKAAVETGRVPVARLDDMVIRLLRAQIVAGVFDDPPRPGGPIDFTAHAKVAQSVGERGIVLLKNEGSLLPLKPNVRRMLLIGGHADIGVMSGGGSSQVLPHGFVRFEGIPAKMFYGKPRLIDPSPPLAALRRALPDADISYNDGHDQAEAARLAHEADVVIVFAERWTNESIDLESLTLPFDENGLIAKVAAANPHAIVVLETANGVTMPWLSAVPAVVEAWYPGERGGEAIANVLTGRVNPSGRLPISFPVNDSELPRPRLPDRNTSASYPREAIKMTPFNVDYNVEGADVGYKWYLRGRRAPLFPFGFGLSYTRFEVSGVAAVATRGTIAVAFDVKNVGSRQGIDIPQVYIDGGGFTRRLVGWDSVALAPGETRHVSVDVDPRLLARFDTAAHGWHVTAGPYAVAVRANALADGPSVTVMLGDRLISARHGLCGAGSHADALCIGSR